MIVEGLSTTLRTQPGSSLSTNPTTALETSSVIPPDSSTPNSAPTSTVDSNPAPSADLVSARSNDPLNSSPSRQADNQPRQAVRVNQNGFEFSSAAAASRTESEPLQLDQQEQAVARELAQIDREVRAHEAAHAAAGGALAGSPSYNYTRGPDGRLYATGGEVGIDLSFSSDPKKAIEEARTVIQAALAPANPSPQDLRVAARARAELIDAQSEFNRLEEELQRPQPVELETIQVEEIEAAEEVVEVTEPEQTTPEDEEQAREEEAQRLREEQELRQERIRQRQEEFAQELAILNQRFQLIQQQLIETGQVDPSTLLQGILVDTQV